MKKSVQIWEMAFAEAVALGLSNLAASRQADMAMHEYVLWISAALQESGRKKLKERSENGNRSH